jgi:hypothetical protein
MAFFCTPANYEELPEDERRACVPIYVSDTDEDGRPVPRVWFDRGVVPAADTLRYLAEYHLRDPWCSSELAERVTHKLARRLGLNVGAYPHRQVIIEARFEVQRLERASQPLVDPYSLKVRRLKRQKLHTAVNSTVQDENAYITHILLDSVHAQIDGSQYQIAFGLLRSGHNWPEILTVMGMQDRFRRQFYRHIAQARRFFRRRVKAR